MNNLFLSFFITGIAGFSTLLGMFSIFFSGKGREKLISYSLIFSAGIMIFLSLFDLIPESISYMMNFYSLIPSLIIGATFIFFGIIFTHFIDNLLVTDGSNLYKVGLISMIALIIHNIPEGIITFLTTTKDIKLGLPLAFSIALHNIPEGISIFIPIYYGSKSKKKAFLYTFIAGFSEVLGAFIAWLFLSHLVNDYFFSFIFAITAGIMLYIAIYELIPESIKYKNKLMLTFWFIIGMLIMLMSKFIV